MPQLGLHGYAIVPFIMGLGCNVPGAMALRLMEGRREKFIAATLMAIAVPWHGADSNDRGAGRGKGAASMWR